MNKLSGYLTDHFTWEEVQHSELAARYEINNSVPTAEIAAACVNTARKMERVRTLFSAPIIVSSWYRCPDLNYKLKSKETSQHLRGEAIDFIVPGAGTPVEVAKKILSYRDLIFFDQLILEHTWIHMSFCSDPNVQNRNQVLSLLKSGSFIPGLTNSEGTPL